MLIQMPLECHIPDKPLPANAAREFDTFIYFCYRENVKSMYKV